MLLAIDVGNTNLVFALIQGESIIARWRIATDPRRTGDEYAVWLNQLMMLENMDRQKVTAIIISTVVPRALHNLDVLSRKYFKLTPIIAGEDKASYNFAMDVDEPNTVGADRAVNAVAAHKSYPQDKIIIDFGTATTFDYVDYNGAYKGGSIAPGINLSLDALVNATAKLPRIAISAPDKSRSVIGRNTEDQMHIGVFWGYVSMMEGLISRMKSEIGRPATVIATGGLAVLFDGYCELFDHVEVDLTLHGLAMLARQAGAKF